MQIRTEAPGPRQSAQKLGSDEVSHHSSYQAQFPRSLPDSLASDKQQLDSTSNQLEQKCREHWAPKPELFIESLGGLVL